jgi:hypothetical protein
MQTPGSGVGLVRGIDPRRMVTTREGQGTPSFEPFLAPGRSCLWCLFDLCFLFRDQQIIGRRMLSLGVQKAEEQSKLSTVARRSTSIQATPHSTAVHRLQCGQSYHSTVSCTTRLHCAYYRATALPASLLRRRLGSPASCQACPYQTTQSSCTPTRGFLVDDASGLPRTLA